MYYIKARESVIKSTCGRKPLLYASTKFGLLESTFVSHFLKLAAVSLVSVLNKVFFWSGRLKSLEFGNERSACEVQTMSFPKKSNSMILV